MMWSHHFLMVKDGHMKVGHTHCHRIVSFRNKSKLSAFSSTLAECELAWRLLRFSSASIFRTLSTSPSSLMYFSLSNLQTMYQLYFSPDVRNVVNVADGQIIATKITLVDHVFLLLLNNVVNAPFQWVFLPNIGLVLFTLKGLSCRQYLSTARNRRYSWIAINKTAFTSNRVFAWQSELTFSCSIAASCLIWPSLPFWVPMSPGPVWSASPCLTLECHRDWLVCVGHSTGDRGCRNSENGTLFQSVNPLMPQSTGRAIQSCFSNDCDV